MTQAIIAEMFSLIKFCSETERFSDILQRAEHSSLTFANKIVWPLCRIAKDLILQKPKEGIKREDDDKLDAAKQALKNRETLQLALSSSLFSGGLDPNHYNMLSEETKKAVAKFAALSEDPGVLKNLNQDAPESKLEAIVTEGKSKGVDFTIGLLQKLVMRTVAYSRIGGQDGLRMTRAAFAVMIKFSDLESMWNCCVESVMLNEDDEGEALDEIRDNYKTIVDRFKSATRMRQWIS